MEYNIRCLGHDTSTRQHYKVNVKLTSTFRQCHDMTEKLLKVTLNPNNTHSVNLRKTQVSTLLEINGKILPDLL